MSTKTTKRADDSREAQMLASLANGLPQVVNRWLGGLPLSSPFKNRAVRFAEYCAKNYDGNVAVAKAWDAVSRHSKLSDDPAELTVFMQLPDALVYDARPAPMGASPLTASTIIADRKRYKELVAHIAAIRASLNPREVRDLFESACVSPDSRKRAGNFRPQIAGLRAGLRAFSDLLSATDPARKILTVQPFSSNAKLQIFANRLAELNRVLRTPQHTALRTLALVNCPDAAAVTVHAIRDAWRSAGN